MHALFCNVAIAVMICSVCAMCIIIERTDETLLVTDI